MNPQFAFLTNRQFWFGVAATISVGIILSVGVPNLMRERLSTYDFNDERIAAGVGREGGGVTKMAVTAVAPIGSENEQDRKVVRTGSMDMLVSDPKQISEKIRGLAEQAGGFLVSSEMYGGDNAASASLTIRVPADKFEMIRDKIASLSVRVESEKVQAEDVTKQYVDQDARLRNLRAQETQYLGILKQAKTVKDTIEVSDKLNQVRGEIEQQQAEFDALSKQVETVALTISLRAEAEARVFGLRWRPLYQLKLAARQGLEGLGDYAASMIAVLFYIPAILLWLATILVSAAIGWRILRWAGRMLFLSRPKAV